LASDDSSYITGIELFVDGGMAQIWKIFIFPCLIRGDAWISISFFTLLNMRCVWLSWKLFTAYFSSIIGTVHHKSFFFSTCSPISLLHLIFHTNF
jgi:hypothetical protein